VRLCAQYTVARMLERDDFAKRYAEQYAIGVHEFLYPLVQGYDSVPLKADVEVGGTDQRFNMLVGREIQKAYGMAPQVVLTLPLLEGTDGVQKMSKSLGNAIGIAEPPAEIFGKVMSISDAMMLRYYELLTSEELGALRRQIESGALHPMDAKKRLARAIVERFYDPATARRELENFEVRFQRRELPDDMTEFVYVNPPARVPLPQLLTKSGMTKSNSEARRKIEEGAVRVDGLKVTDMDFGVAPVETPQIVVQIGRRNVRRIIFSSGAGQGA
jgi:tyrosyl-tRNA synthetase